MTWPEMENAAGLTRLYERASLSASVADKVKMVDPEAACSETVVRVLPSEATLVNTGAVAAI